MSRLTAETRVQLEGGEQCEVEWRADRVVLCGEYHRCQLPKYHQGEPHRCDCGWTRRWMRRDAPDDE